MRGIQQAYDLSLYSKRVNRFETIPLEREFELGRRYRLGDVEAGQAIINSNLRLVLKISRYYCRYECDPMEIVLEGNMGLVEALERFDPDKGVEFSTHAIWWVHRHIREYIRSNSQATAIPIESISPSIPRRVIWIMQRSLSRIVSGSLHVLALAKVLLRSAQGIRSFTRRADDGSSSLRVHSLHRRIFPHDKPDL